MYREVSCIQVYLLVERFYSGLFGLVVLFEMFQRSTNFRDKIVYYTSCVFPSTNIANVNGRKNAQTERPIHPMIFFNKFNHNAIQNCFSRRHAQKFSYIHLKFRFACGLLTSDEILILEN